jgi:4-hydroxy-tetrahydrodipicolinate synthase
MNIAMIRVLIDALLANDESAAAKQQTVSVIRQVMEKVPVIAAMKALYAQAAGAAGWAIVRPPLTAFGDAALAAMIGDLEKAGYDPSVALKGLPG